MDKHVRMAGSLGGLYSPHCAAVHPARLARGLSDTLDAKGVRIFENSPAINIAKGCVTTANGKVKADKVVIATEGYSGAMKATAGRLAAIYSFLIITELLPQSVFDEIGLGNRQTFADGRALVTYGQRTADNRIAFGYGARYNFGNRAQDRFPSTDCYFKTLHDILVQLFPILKDAQIDQCWGGPMGASVNMQAFVQYDAPSGVAATNLGGRTMAELLLDMDTERTNLRLLVQTGDPLKKFQSWPPEPARWLGASTLMGKLRFDDWRDAD